MWSSFADFQASVKVLILYSNRDFNEIISAAEKTSSSYRSPRQMQEFKKALEDCNLSDLGSLGPRFTWSNGRYGPDFSRERLDRAVANGDWSNIYDVVEVNVLPRNVSDHHPLLVSFSNSRDVKWRKSRMFIYEASWAKQKESQRIIISFCSKNSCF